MPQTILAVCAIAVFSVFALNQHRVNAQIDQSSVAGEIEIAATGVARDHLTSLAGYAFDEADVDATSMRTTTTGLSATPGPDAGETDPSLYDDIDDYHGRIDTLGVNWHGENIPVEVMTSVRYVNPSNATQGSGTPTLAKELLVTVNELNDNVQGRARVTVNLAQIFTPAYSQVH